MRPEFIMVHTNFRENLSHKNYPVYNIFPDKGPNLQEVSANLEQSEVHGSPAPKAIHVASIRPPSSPPLMFYQITQFLRRPGPTIIIMRNWATHHELKSCRQLILSCISWKEKATCFTRVQCWNKLTCIFQYNSPRHNDLGTSLTCRGGWRARLSGNIQHPSKPLPL